MEDKREKEFFDMKKGIRFAALSLAASLIFTLPQNTLSVDAAVNPPLKTVESSNVPTKYTGLKLSILGDSLSTFNDYIPRDYNIFIPVAFRT